MSATATPILIRVLTVVSLSLGQVESVARGYLEGADVEDAAVSGQLLSVSVEWRCKKAGEERDRVEIEVRKCRCSTESAQRADTEGLASRFVGSEVEMPVG